MNHVRKREMTAGAVQKKTHKLLTFSGCDYLGLSGDPRLREAAEQAMRKYGVSRSASRSTTGDHPLYQQLESELAEYSGAEAAVLVPTGYLGNLAVAQVLPPGLRPSKEPNAHPAIEDACQLLQPGDAEGKVFWLEAVKGTSGEIPNLRERVGQMQKQDWLVIDEAHSFGVIGKGRGILELFGLKTSPRWVRTITFSKALGGFGGAVLASRKICQAIRQKSRLFAGSTPFPLALAAANLEALKIIRQEPERMESVCANSFRIKGELALSGWRMALEPTPIFRYDPPRAAALRQMVGSLKAARIEPPLISYPPKSRPFFRFALSFRHSARDVDRLLEALKKAVSSHP